MPLANPSVIVEAILRSMQEDAPQRGRRNPAREEVVGKDPVMFTVR
jgi:hypothetical protein